ncbi:hypothetical protein CYMTET_35485, partial [Cymbomonas tetramitiformis]
MSQEELQRRQNAHVAAVLAAKSACSRCRLWMEGGMEVQGDASYAGDWGSGWGGRGGGKVVLGIGMLAVIRMTAAERGVDEDGDKNLRWWWMPITLLLEPVSATLSLVAELGRGIAFAPVACLRVVFLLPHLIATNYVYLMHEARITLIFLQVTSLVGLMVAYLSYQSYLREKQRRMPNAAPLPPRALPALASAPLPQLAAPPMLQYGGSRELNE